MKYGVTNRFTREAKDSSWDFNGAFDSSHALTEALAAVNLPVGETVVRRFDKIFEAHEVVVSHATKAKVPSNEVHIDVATTAKVLLFSLEGHLEVLG